MWWTNSCTPSDAEEALQQSHALMGLDYRLVQPHRSAVDANWVLLSQEWMQVHRKVRQEAVLVMEKAGEEYILACKAFEAAKQNQDLLKDLEDTKKQKLAEHLQCLRQLKNIDLLSNIEPDPSSLD